jgi:asparagine synthetase B (glutamine-hydrolysing)
VGTSVRTRGQTIEAGPIFTAMSLVRYKVVMTGEGSDEILAGYAHFCRDMLLYNRGRDACNR